MLEEAADGAALDARGLVKTRGSDRQSFVLKAPEIRLERGRLTAIIGESGCGKSTLLDMMALISAPDQAERFKLNIASPRSELSDVTALWAARSETGLAELRRSVGYILQTGGLLPFLSVAQNAALSFQIAGRSVDMARIRHLADRLGIGDQLRKAPAHLSGGQRQRAAILRALAHEPALVLADEPTAAVDRTRAIEIMDDLTRLVRETGVTLALVSHDAALVAPRADCIYGFSVERVSNTETVSTCRQLSAEDARRLAEGLR